MWCVVITIFPQIKEKLGVLQNTLFYSWYFDLRLVIVVYSEEAVLPDHMKGKSRVLRKTLFYTRYFVKRLVIVT